MSDNRPPEKSDEFDRVLQQWRVSTPLPPRFQEQVWRKIEAAETRARMRPSELIRYWLESVMPRPGVAASYIGILLVTGFLAGTWQAQEQNVRAEQVLERKYVESVDPYQAPRSQQQ